MILFYCFSTFFDYYTGIQIEKSKKETKENFGFVKYRCQFRVFRCLNITFFLLVPLLLMQGVGFKIITFLLDVVLPVGISFYTFHGLSYVIDITSESKLNIIC
jgi:D-alanyl-lipoteichoic acid acyltransferase DltB (MBOAT superfamily)